MLPGVLADKGKENEAVRYTEYHAGVPVIRDKELLPEAMRKLAKLEDMADVREKIFHNHIWELCLNSVPVQMSQPGNAGQHLFGL